ncbi:MAG: short-chain dehydrogenase [Anaerocolumna sp.]|jgi:short-subunit dehydrogenase|nr:short-chain dehydrogenase [Anaerocolumna sp.]
MKTMVIVGAGRLLGMSLARQFGGKGYQVILIARNESKLIEMTEELQKQNIKAAYFSADIYYKNQISKVFKEIYTIYGNIDVLEFSPRIDNYTPSPVLSLTAEQVKDTFTGNVLGAIHCINEVLPVMLESKSGALLFTSGLSAIYPNPQMADTSIAKAGLRSYIINLEKELILKGIFVGHIILGIFLNSDTGGMDDPEILAKYWYDKYTMNLYGEEIYPKGVTSESVILP